MSKRNLGGYITTSFDPLNFTGTVSYSDPYFENVTLLLHGDGTNGTQNNTFIDGSTNNFTITRNGNTTQGAFSPYGDLWSNYFDGTGDYLSVANNTAFDFGTGDFTIECWFYIAGNSSLNNSNTRAATLTSTNPTSGTITGYEFNIDGDSTTTGTGLSFQHKVSNTSYGFAYTGTISQGAWHHAAVSRSGTTTRMFLDGEQVASTTFSNQNISTSTNPLLIASSRFTGYLHQLNGYVSNFRVVKGTAVYTTNFTPPTAPLTAITNTSLLTCQSNRFIDNSSNAFAITRNGDVKVTKFSPFNPSVAYATGVTGGSAYFDGTGDNLTLPAGAAFAFGTGNFTVECWLYPFTAPGLSYIIDARNASQTGTWAIGFGLGGTGGKLGWYTGTTVNENADTVLVKPYCWNHVAYVRNGTTGTLYLNGASVLSFTDSTNYSTSPTTSYIGSRFSAADYWNGLFSNIRVVKGTAVYTGNFTPSTAPLTAITNTSLLLNFTNAAIIDNSMMNNLETVGNAQISTTQKKFGTGSLYFDGTGDYLSFPLTPITYFNSENFTVEFWMYTAGINSMGIMAFPHNSSNYATILFYGNGASDLRFFSSSAGTAWDVANNVVVGTINLNAWNHVAVARQGSSIRCFLNGTLGSTTTFSGTYTGTFDRAWIGATAANVAYNGYIDDLRITKGIARYTANFTPPTVPFEDL